MSRIFGDNRLVGVASAIAAVALGLLYMALAGAPMRLLLMNVAALLIGLVLFALADRLAADGRGARGPLLVALSLLLLATALWGVSASGATRWISVAGLTVQPSLLLVPVVVVAYASKRDRPAMLALAVAVVAVALQPDRAAAAMLLAGTVAVSLRHRDRESLAVAAVAGCGLLATLLQPDNLPAMPYVDQILYTAVAAHPVAGLAVWTGVLLLFAPGLAGRGKGTNLVFCAVWGSMVLAAALGNYPTPLVGYGGSAIIGYLLSLLPLGSGRAAVESGSAVGTEGQVRDGDGQQLRYA